ncbi:putative quinol monooxygenase [Cobetia marina]|jgi:quinol monooxygenase YgiN|uniref:putative quinol monooxygenase n=1 Tax=Cobetia marina TaxID=28258 RepID=UPI0038516928
MIWVIATVTAKEGHVQDVFNELCAVAPTVREEDGCHAYHPCLDSERAADKDNDPRPDTITVVEAWESHDALQAHRETEHMQRFRDNASDWIADGDIRILSPAG